MKGFNLTPQSLMKVAPLNDFYQEPKQTYTQKGGWFGVDDSCDEATEKKSKRVHLKTRTKGNA